MNMVVMTVALSAWTTSASARNRGIAWVKSASNSNPEQWSHNLGHASSSLSATGRDRRCSGCRARQHQRRTTDRHSHFRRLPVAGLVDLEPRDCRGEARNNADLTAAALSRLQVAPHADRAIQRRAIVDEHLDVGPHHGQACDIATAIVRTTVPGAAAGDVDEIGALGTRQIGLEIRVAAGAQRAVGVECEDHPQVNRCLASLLLAVLHENVDETVSVDLGVGAAGSFLHSAATRAPS